MRKKLLIILFIILFIFFIYKWYITKSNDNKYILAYVPYKYIEINDDELILKKDEEFSFIHNIESNEIENDIKFKIENDKIIKMNGKASIKALEIGETNLIISKENGNILKNIKVKVNAIPTEIKVNQTEFKMKKDESKQLKVNVLPENLENKKVKFSSSDENIAIVDEKGNVKAIGGGEVFIHIETDETPKISNKIKVKVIDIEVRENGATYVDGILLVNKKYTLPSTYNFGVDKTAKEKFNQMKKEALKDNISLTIVSDFRSYNTQSAIYNKNVNLHGTRIANRFSAKPGQSEHQTGLAFDINKANRSFVGTKEAKWLQENCYKFGFIIRYPRNKESITGYVYEPWHIRYVGEKVAKAIYESGQCLEEYLGVN